MLGGGAVLVVAALALGEGGELARGVSAASFAAWLYLALFGSLVAFTAYAWLLQQRSDLAGRDAPVRQSARRDRARRASCSGETFDATTIVGALIVIGAVFATIRSESRAAAPVPAPVVEQPRSAPPVRAK